MPLQLSLNSRAFTLIELLVVISITALLIAILLPTLRTAQESGRRVVCQSNLRQAGVGIIAYAVDNDDHFPDRDTLSGVRPGQPRAISLFRRAWNAVDPANAAAGPEQIGMPALLGRNGYIEAQDVWLCPAQSPAMRAYANTYNWTMDARHAEQKWYDMNGAVLPVKELMWDNTKYRPSTPNNPMSGVLVLPASQREIPHQLAGGAFRDSVDAVNALMTDGHVTIRGLKLP